MLFRSLMIFTQGGSCTTANVDGGYVRYGIRQLTATNKSALNSIITGFSDNPCGQGGDQGSSAVGGQAMHEAYLYFAGKTSRSGITQVIRDYASSTVNTVAGPLPGNPFSSSSATAYTSAITDACQKSYIIFISNGPFSNGDDSPSSTLYAGSSGLVPGAQPIALNPSGSQSSWVDEYAQYLATTGVSVLGSNQKIFSYAVEVDPSTSGQGPGHTALMKSMANQGKGKYFGVTSANAGQAIVDALLSIFTEIQAVNSVFAASTLPVSVNVRGTNLNQLYIGVFRPDAKDLPRWLGNLKAYQLKKDASTGAVFTVDKNLVPAQSSTTGFITGSAVSFWTDPALPNSTYWSFRSSSVNGIGGSSDSPDGDLVEKGGAAQQIRGLYFSNGVNGTPSRPLYTCTQGSFATCLTSYSASSSALSATPFSTANTDIDAAALSLDTRSVTPLSALVTKSVSALVDRRPVSLNNSGGAPLSGTLSVTNNSSIGVTLANANAIDISAMDNGAQVRTSTCATSGTGNVAKVTFTAAHGLPSSGTMIVAVPSDSNSKYIASGATFTKTSTTEVTYPANGVNTNAASVSCNVTTSNTTTNVTTTTPHGFGAVGTTQTATITGASPSQFAITGGTITITGTNTFSFSTTVSAAPTLSSAKVSSATSTVTATLASSAPAGTFQAGQRVTISGAAATTPSYNGTFTIGSMTTSGGLTTKFTYTTSSAITTAASGTINAQQTASTATVTFSLPHGFTHGNTITISGATPAAYNGAFPISCTGNDCTDRKSVV